MFKITEVVPASQIWPTAQDFTDKGFIPGLVRGYNIEVRKADGTTGWMSSEWIEGDPEVVFNDEFHCWSRHDYGFTATGRICFRGYGFEKFDYGERDYYVVRCDEHGKVLA